VPDQDVDDSLAAAMAHSAALPPDADDFQPDTTEQTGATLGSATAAASPADGTPATVPELTAHAIEQRMIAAGHQLFTRRGKLVVTNASTLTDADRALIASRKDALITIVPSFPEPPQPKPETIVQFLGQAPQVGPPADWKLEMPPSLDGITDIELDFETTGLKWHGQDRPIGFSLGLPGGFYRYYPFAHVDAKQLNEEKVKEWARDNLPGKRITNAYVNFDIHMSRVWGCDLVELGCSFSDVMHYAALLDDHRKQFALNVLAKDFLGREKIGMNLDVTRMAHYEPWVVAQRAIGDVQTVAELRDVMYTMMEKQKLHVVRALEDSVIPVVNEMEKNGAPIDIERLHREAKESEDLYYKLIRDVSHDVGFNFDGSDEAWIRVFEKFKIPLVMRRRKNADGTTDLTDPGKPTFKDAVLARVEHPTVKTARFAAQLDSLRSKIYKPYVENIGADGILRVEFNQLRIDDEGGKRGTVSGRFSAPYVQQVPNHDNHFEVFGEQFYPRYLYQPGVDQLFFAGDAQQIEYRIFASRAQNPSVLAAYKNDPALSFHKLMHPKITKYRADFSYSNMKNFNFMKIYGGGLVKMATMMGFITEEEGEEITRARQQKTSPLLAKAREIDGIYAKEMPEAGPLMRKAMHLAMPACNKYCNRNDEMHRLYKHRGYVKTILGRRARFPNEYKIHKALNSIIQGSAADIMKTKLVELFNLRKELSFTMRMTIHDEVTGDVPAPECADRIREVLNVQSLPLEVPILWSTGTGQNWAEAK
jgi:DNA polymerase I-like protein with 3'-5' exonuclease and polymerase domains